MCRRSSSLWTVRLSNAAWANRSRRMGVCMTRSGSWLFEAQRFQVLGAPGVVGRRDGKVKPAGPVGTQAALHDFWAAGDPSALPCTPAAPHSQRRGAGRTDRHRRQHGRRLAVFHTRIFFQPGDVCSQPAASTGFALAAPQRSAVSADESSAVALRSMGHHLFCKVN